MNAPIGIGLIGLGKHGERYAGHIENDLKGLRIAAVTRRDARQGRARADDLGARFHDDLWGLAADRAVEAVVAVVPPSLHREVVRACTAEGKPLLIEKPFAINAKEAVAMVARIEGSGVPVMVAHTLRFSAVVQKVLEWAPEVGAPHQIILGQSFEPSRLAWLDDPAISGGGNILHTGIHQFDLARYLTGAEAQEVSCFAGRVATQSTEDSFAATLFLGQAGGGTLLAAISASRGTRSRYGEIRLIGNAGQIVADHAHHSIALLQGNRIVREEGLADLPTVRETLRAFEAMVRGNAPAPITPVDGARAVAIVDACYRSLRSGHRESVAQVQEN